MNTIHRQVISFLWLSFLTLACKIEEIPKEITKAPKVQTSVGTVKGYYKNSTHGRIYEAFEGIPYAEPPVGKLRFQPPEKVRPWFGELSAIKHSPSCLQYVDQINKTSSNIKGDEDCLYLNIYAPEKKKNVNSKQKLLPVIFWIHGGMFQRGSGNLASANRLMDYDVILVTFNYRLGPLGFLSTEDSSIPGNMGLKDQNAALRWIHDNIKFFGGNPKQITLIGLNAGGASVHYHYLSPLSIDLFQGGISLSGTALNFWAQKRNSKETAKEFATALGCPTQKISKMIECLKSRPSHTLINTAGKFVQSMRYSYVPFGPVVEKNGNKSFIDDSPLAMINNGKCQKKPWITGVINEGLYPASEIIANSKCLSKIDQQWIEMAPGLMGFNDTSIPVQKHNETAVMIKKHYFGSQHINQNTSNIFLKMMEDRLFAVDSVKAAKLQAKTNKNNVWYYSFSFKELHKTNEFKYHKNLGICLSEETSYIFEEQITGSLTEKCYQMQQQIIEFWISFAYKKIPHFGKIHWPTVDSSKSELSYLHIDAPGFYIAKKNEDFGNQKFWNSIVPGETHEIHNKYSNISLTNETVGDTLKKLSNNSSVEWSNARHNLSQVTLNRTSNIQKEQQLSTPSIKINPSVIPQNGNQSSYNNTTTQYINTESNMNSTEKIPYRNKLDSTNYNKREISYNSMGGTNNNQSSNEYDKRRQIISNWLSTYLQHGKSNVSDANGFFKYHNNVTFHIHNATDNKELNDTHASKKELQLDINKDR